MNPQPLWYKACALPMCYNCCAATFNNKYRYQLSTTTSPITAKQSLLLLIYSLFNFPHQIFRLRSAGVVFVSRPSFAFNLKREFLLSNSLSLSHFPSLSLSLSLSPRHTLFLIKKSLEPLKLYKSSSATEWRQQWKWKYKMWCLSGRERENENGRFKLKVRVRKCAQPKSTSWVIQKWNLVDRASNSKSKPNTDLLCLKDRDENCRLVIRANYE